MWADVLGSVAVWGCAPWGDLSPPVGAQLEEREGLGGWRLLFAMERPFLPRLSSNWMILFLRISQGPQCLDP